MDEAAKRNGRFYGFTETQRDEKLKRLAAALDHCGPRVIYCSVDASAFQAIRAKDEQTHEPWRFVKNPIVWAVFRLSLSISQYLDDEGISDQCEIFPDDNPQIRSKVQAAYRISRGFMRKRAQSLLPSEMVFRDDEMHAPLQAADLVAWLVRRSQSGTHPFMWMYDAMPNVTKSPTSEHVDGGLLSKILADSHAFQEGDAEVVSEWYATLREVLDLD